MAKERIQKILAQAGIASRRKAEELIKLGEVTVNGKVATIGEKADLSEDAIKVEGKLLQSNAKRPPMYLAFYKPKGVISMFADPEGRPTLADYLARVKERLFPIGRLDFNSEGLILLTNDGAFSEKLQKRSDVPRVYHVKVRGHIEPADLARLERGAKVGERAFRPHSVRLAENLSSKSVIEWVTLESGAMDVKGAFEARGFLVEKITRTAIGHLSLRGIKPGEYKLLKASQVEALLNQPELGLRALAEDAEAAVPFIDEDEETGEKKRIKPEKAKAHFASEDRPRRSFSDRRSAPKKFGGDRDRGSRGFGRRDGAQASSGGSGKITPRGPDAPPISEWPKREYKPRAGGFRDREERGGFGGGGFKPRGGGYKSRGFEGRDSGGGEGFRSRGPRSGAGFKAGGRGPRSGGSSGGGGGRIQIKRRST